MTSSNKTLFSLVGALLTTLGEPAYAIFFYKSPECLNAIKNNLQTVASLLCGPDFGSDDLMIMAFIGIIAFLVINNIWDPIMNFFKDLFGET